MGLANSLDGKTAIVTGSGNGIGRAIAMRFAAEGARVTVADIEEDAGQETVDRITADGGTAIFVRTDTTDSDAIKATVSATIAAHGEIDVLVNNAAAFVFGKVEDVTQDDWAKVFGVNVIGYANCVREVLPSMRKQNGGAIVNIASVSSFIAQPEFIPYNASKGAVAQLTRCLAMDLSVDNIRVNAVCPGSIRTRATDRHIAELGLDPEESYEEFGQDSLMKRMGKPSEIASGALFLASDEASFMTGAQIVIDGGATID
ncbi:SDR family NAD(P)-dependent oxidoreductase [Candidatus Lucifugimonas marina]|jgi:NAD(P)-dependent dehydrogenase (short-subunit alcohol dehydrogenase family)|uniref:Glucose 1-dehydrogenase n=1 Tax=Candidatus Lucifugimonas marina TaxID=3038979 RepID=A0AAJ5ZI46_9CHLR|nr:glucose 1-dehydrogenase [SAR202 cluster bacterium JH702]MDG0868532.1 glucose 1-dehydrogenase [SAR202 cluster bacterium JH639]WFG35171.1 glucose 1-dehydrogenase [SAR202 cluster bacterium JH545]WFG39121.1 glucose 1-dehydrogenase [SAR202 cluster bacterium JH1073]